MNEYQYKGFEVRQTGRDFDVVVNGQPIAVVRHAESIDQATAQLDGFLARLLKAGNVWAVSQNAIPETVAEAVAHEAGPFKAVPYADYQTALCHISRTGAQNVIVTRIPGTDRLEIALAIWDS